ncbi:hypothetical protein Pla163_02930 [Planctomycetes bacterium Pla163]|jgi:hypothetical protein|uniref:Uncharacterized protein n=2 Tax=Rohdeia mirabilis TaxID=2528008 RepID=A0A518CVE3_9BACT|nr:hypothetical protein Pla163_02930 [Planctomycetes bacterium Pla163]
MEFWPRAEALARGSQKGHVVERLPLGPTCTGAMKHHAIATTVLAATLPLFALTGCSSDAEALEGAGEHTERAWDDLTDYTADQYDAFADSTRDALSALKERAESAQDSSSDAFEERIAALEQKLEEMGDATGDAWRDARDAVVDGLERLGDDIDGALDS